MATVLVKIRVADFSAWKPVFDGSESLRREHGIEGHTIYRDHGDPNAVVMALKTGDLARAQEFVASDALREVMMRAGVQGPPEITFCDDIESKSYS